MKQWRSQPGAPTALPWTLECTVIDLPAVCFPLEPCVYMQYKHTGPFARKCGLIYVAHTPTRTIRNVPFRNALQPEVANRAYDRRKLLTIPQNRFGWSSYGPWALDQPLYRP